MNNELLALYNTILMKKESNEEGSYTSYLFEKGLDKILKKVGEENTEVIIASLKNNNEELINELADLFYHLTVLMVEKEITFDDVSDELSRRSKKTGNLKSERKKIEKY